MFIAWFRSTSPESLVDTTMWRNNFWLVDYGFVLDEDDGSLVKGFWQGKKVTIPCVCSLLLAVLSKLSGTSITMVINDVQIIAVQKHVYKPGKRTDWFQLLNAIGVWFQLLKTTTDPLAYSNFSFHIRVWDNMWMSCWSKGHAGLVKKGTYGTLNSKHAVVISEPMSLATKTGCLSMFYI